MDDQHRDRPATQTPYRPQQSFRNGGRGGPRPPKEAPKPNPEQLFYASLVGKSVKLTRRSAEGGPSAYGISAHFTGVLAWFSDHSLGLTVEDAKTILVMKGDISTIEPL